MRACSALPVFWCSFQLLSASRSARSEDISEVCGFAPNEVGVQKSRESFEVMEMSDLEDAFTCLLYPTHVINCSWSFLTLEEDTQLLLYIRECENDTLVDLHNPVSVERVGSKSWHFNDNENNHIVVVFNMSQIDTWKVYAAKYELDVLRLLPPPAIVTASIEDGKLFIAWTPPDTKTTSNPFCFDYELHVGEQKVSGDLAGKVNFTKEDIAPTHTYKVRMRTRVTDQCSGCRHWSEWSPTVTVEQPPCSLDPLVIVAVSLGIPMILLAVLLLVRHQRLTKVLFPPIPRPPPEYKYFLERNDPLTFFHPAPAKHEEEVTEVEDAEPNPGRTF
ncbi:granulocyte-macrophage colony-stimulating factor receptor subunit alpha [Kryptolebias marmoratus]|uniref:granulocyte-macrophage colony-stimulating factor receptor subunit alpha n=1 Tax=Kryptolebias marmoratus TaxID=37003 RepID=UPI0007F871ED|nr:granulocyte-macrophage colony-stimulating factor receptor subunit alpha [Kryptolebias marmoratus]XP_037837664.1 granulocyte-macrophage colony-stimulating factor receptor subunit alpha [Kryptolebias marmoratus]